MAKWPSWRSWRTWTPNPRPPDDTSVFQEHRNWFQLRIVLLITAITPRCPEVIRLLSLGMEQPLPWWTRVRLRIHNLMCSFCERYAQQLRALRRMAQAFPEKVGEASDEKLPPEVKERMRAALRE